MSERSNSNDHIHNNNNNNQQYINSYNSITISIDDQQRRIKCFINWLYISYIELASFLVYLDISLYIYLSRFVGQFHNIITRKKRGRRRVYCVNRTCNSLVCKLLLSNTLY